MRKEIFELIKPGVGFWIDSTDAGIIVGIETNELNEIVITNEELFEVINCLVDSFHGNQNIKKPPKR